VVITRSAVEQWDLPLKTNISLNICESVKSMDQTYKQKLFRNKLNLEVKSELSNV